MGKQKKYSQEFKDEAVKLVTEQGYSYSQVSRDIGASTVSIRDWVLKSQVKFGNPSGSVMTPAGEEMARIRKENKRLKEEVEILKKATAFFAKESQ